LRFGFDAVELEEEDGAAAEEKEAEEDDDKVAAAEEEEDDDDEDLIEGAGVFVVTEVAVAVVVVAAEVGAGVGAGEGASILEAGASADAVTTGASVIAGRGCKGVAPNPKENVENGAAEGACGGGGGGEGAGAEAPKVNEGTEAEEPNENEDAATAGAVAAGTPKLVPLVVLVPKAEVVVICCSGAPKLNDVVLELFAELRATVPVVGAVGRPIEPPPNVKSPLRLIEGVAVVVDEGGGGGGGAIPNAGADPKLGFENENAGG